jgi:hypothetical protein
MTLHGEPDPQTSFGSLVDAVIQTAPADELVMLADARESLLLQRENSDD